MLEIICRFSPITLCHFITILRKLMRSDKSCMLWSILPPCYHHVNAWPASQPDEILHKICYSTTRYHPVDTWLELSILISLRSLCIATDIISHVISRHYTDEIAAISSCQQADLSGTKIYSWQWLISLYQVLCISQTLGLLSSSGCLLLTQDLATHAHSRWSGQVLFWAVGPMR